MKHPDWTVPELSNIYIETSLFYFFNNLTGLELTKHTKLPNIYLNRFIFTKQSITH